MPQFCWQIKDNWVKFVILENPYKRQQIHGQVLKVRWTFVSTDRSETKTLLSRLALSCCFLAAYVPLPVTGSESGLPWTVDFYMDSGNRENLPNYPHLRQEGCRCIPIRWHNGWHFSSSIVSLGGVLNRYMFQFMNTDGSIEDLWQAPIFHCTDQARFWCFFSRYR